MATTMYGIPNCDTIKKARAFLAGRGVDYRFHDYKTQGVPAAELARWVDRLGWERLVNHQGNTWRKLAPEVQAGVHDAPSAIALMLDQPSVIKRPVLLHGDALHVGFAVGEWARLFA